MPYMRCLGANLYYEDQGQGPVIVLLHGVTMGVRTFQAQLDDLSADHRVVALDFRGHGRSEKTELGHTVAQYARDVHTFLEQLDLEDVTLAGWSLGALVSWEYVRLFGTGRLRALVDIDMEATRFQWADYDHGLADVHRLKENIALVQGDHEAIVERMLQDTFKDQPNPEAAQMIRDEVSRTPATIKATILTDALLCDHRDVLAKIDVPMLVCAGASEGRGTVASVRNVAELVPEAGFELFEGSDHNPHLEEPERFNRVVRSFVQGLGT